MKEICTVCGEDVHEPCKKMPVVLGTCICEHLTKAILAKAPTTSREPNDDFARRARQKDRLLALAETIALKTFEKDKEYGSSWKMEGGIGAWFTFKRKWDRMTTSVKGTEFMGQPAERFDVFRRFEIDRREEGILDDVRDLIGYLFVLLEEMMERGYVKEPPASGVSEISLKPAPVPESDWIRGRVDHPAPYGFEGEN